MPAEVPVSELEPLHVPAGRPPRLSLGPAASSEVDLVDHSLRLGSGLGAGGGLAACTPACHGLMAYACMQSMCTHAQGAGGTAQVICTGDLHSRFAQVICTADLHR